MKKQKLKNYLKLGILLFGVSIFFIACQKEELYQQDAITTTETSYKVISLNEIEKLKPVVNNIKQVKPKIAALNRNFSSFLPLENIDTSKVIQYTNETGFSTYTFKIESEQPNTINFENLHLLETDQGYIGYILSYEPDEIWYNDVDNFTPEGDHVFNLKTYQGYITKYSLEREVIWSNNPNVQNNIASRTTTLCTISIVEECCHKYSGNPTGACHPRGPRCNGPFNTVNVETCISLPGGGSNTGNEGEGNYGGGSNTNEDDCQTSGTNILDGQPIAGINGDCAPNIVAGVKPPVEPQEENGCETLKNLAKTDSLSVNIKPIIDNLKTKTALDKEYSISFAKEYNYDLYSYADPEGIREGPNKLNSWTRIGPNWFGQAHTHPSGSHPMYTWRDIKTLNSLYTNINEYYDKTSAFIIIVNDDGTVYAIMVDNQNVLYQALQDDLNATEGEDEEEKADNLNEKLKKDYDKEVTNGNSDLERVFLKKFKDYGISLYKASNNSMENWDKLKLPDNTPNPEVEHQPCN